MAVAGGDARVVDTNVIVIGARRPHSLTTTLVMDDPGRAPENPSARPWIAPQ
jgi:hypothetical protein